MFSGLIAYLGHVSRIDGDARSGMRLVVDAPEAVAEAGATSKAQMGAVMKLAQAKAAGRADGKALSQEVQRQLP